MTRRHNFLWKLFLFFAFISGAVLRLIWPGDMEYKEDEEYMFLRHIHVGTEPWPWLGIPSGVYIKNPGMSVWVFLLLGKLFRVTNPMELCRAVEILNITALGLMIYFAVKIITPKEQKSWFWAMALACVNPFAVMYHRKIWAQSVLPIFSLFFLMSWWKRHRRGGAFFWGLLGACMGQIHMSGFFFSAGFVLWALIFDRRSIQWKPWFLGSVFGSLTLIPWFVHLATEPTGHPLVFGWGEAIQLKFWVFWITDSLGLHLGNALGVLNGNGLWDQISDFIRYPLILGHPSFMVGIAHLVIALLGVGIVFRKILTGKWPRNYQEFFRGNGSETVFAQNSALFGYGILITVSSVLIHRFYLLVTFPLEFVFLARLALSDQKWGQLCLTGLFVAELFISMNFLVYIHDHDGAIHGDYGQAFRTLKANPEATP